jgi:hypothetical protein
MNLKNLAELSRLMDMTDEEYDVWLDQASDEEVDRSIELFEEGRREMNIKAQSLETIIEAAEDVTEAKSLLEQFTLRGSK